MTATRSEALPRNRKPARRELRRYREEVCEDARRLRARSAALVRQSREVRRLRVVGGTAGPTAP